MNTASILFCLCLSLPTGGQARDAWIAEDKFKHFFASFAVTSIAASSARTAGLDADRSIIVGAGVGTGAGVWKELRDLRRPGETASFRDLVWDLAGVGAALATHAQTR